jgi:hypothetical protein
LKLYSSETNKRGEEGRVSGSPKTDYCTNSEQPMLPMLLGIPASKDMYPQQFAIKGVKQIYLA